MGKFILTEDRLARRRVAKDHGDATGATGRVT